MSASGWGRVCLAAAVFVSGPAWAQGTSWFPASNQHATLMFEDLWPSQGDYDFNDLVLRANVRTDEDLGGDVTALTYNFSVFALGASKCSGVAVRLAGVDPSQITATRQEGTPGVGNGSPWTASTPAVVSDGAGGSIVPISTDVRQDLCGNQSGFLNTLTNKPTAYCAPVALEIEFATPWAGAPSAPGDVFLFRCGQTGHQVHRMPFYGPTGGPYDVDESLYLTAHDASEVDPVTKAPTGDDFYLDGNRVPWALLLPDSTYAIPAENARIDQVMPGILAFAAGTGGQDFWHYLTGNVFDFPGGAVPPLPFASFVDSPEQIACEAAAPAFWTGTSCDCSPVGAGFTWNGAACEGAPDLTDQIVCDADPYGAWNAGAQVCECAGTMLWGGVACFEPMDQRASACEYGSYGPTTQIWYSGGGDWNGLTCDCSALGEAWEWNGFGCYDTSSGTAGMCEAGGGTWNEAYLWTWNPWFPPQPCDCSNLGPHYQWDGDSCEAWYSPADVEECESTGGIWRGSGWGCDCSEAGNGWSFDGDQCRPSPAEAICIAEGGDWMGSSCDCTPVGEVWTGTPNDLSNTSASCADGIAAQCAWSGGSWESGTCVCGPDTHYVPELGSCFHTPSMAIGCANAGYSWDAQALECACPDPWTYFDGMMCVPDDGEAAMCESAGGTYWPGVWDPNGGLSFGSCDCPEGQVFAYTDDPLNPNMGWWAWRCAPYALQECMASGGWWNTGADPDTCDCPPRNGVPGDPWYQPGKTWNGQTCAYSLERDACEQGYPRAVWTTETWDPMTGTPTYHPQGTCDCTNVGSWNPVSGMQEWQYDPDGVWNPETLQCESPKSNCQREGGYWDPFGSPTNPTCDCNYNNWGAPATQMRDWNPATEHCEYSGEASGCREMGSWWGPEMVYDPMLGYHVPTGAETCDCYNVNGYQCWDPQYMTNYCGPESFDWDPDRVECVDNIGRYTCVIENNGWWDDYAQTCDCNYMSMNSERWDPVAKDCVYDPQVAACQTDGGWWGPDPGYWDPVYGWMPGGGQTCNCQAYQNETSVSWSWDPIAETGECTSPEEAQCEAAGGDWANNGLPPWDYNAWAFCDCMAVAPDAYLYPDPVTGEMVCGNPQRDACEATGSNWDPMFWTCDCAGTGPFDAWDGNSCAYSTEKEGCVTGGGTWRTDTMPQHCQW